jgi:hypothetical protein
VADRVSVETSSGDYSFPDADIQEIQTESSSGDLAIESRENRLARVRIETSSGDVRLSLPGDAEFRAEADQSSGDMRVGFADGQRGYRREGARFVPARDGRRGRPRLHVERRFHDRAEVTPPQGLSGLSLSLPLALPLP